MQKIETIPQYSVKDTIEEVLAKARAEGSRYPTGFLRAYMLARNVRAGQFYIEGQSICLQRKIPVTNGNEVFQAIADLYLRTNAFADIAQEALFNGLRALLAELTTDMMSGDISARQELIEKTPYILDLSSELCPFVDNKTVAADKVSDSSPFEKMEQDLLAGPACMIKPIPRLTSDELAIMMGGH